MQKVLLIILLGLFLTPACGRQEIPPQQETAFATRVPIPMDTGLKLQLLEIRDTFGHGPSIILALENHSDRHIWFPTPGYGAHLYIYSESSDEWQEVQDRSMPLGKGEEVLVPKGKGINYSAIMNVAPNLPDLNEPVIARIVVIGKVYRDGSPTDEKIGTYIDVKLKP